MIFLHYFPFFHFSTLYLSIKRRKCSVALHNRSVRVCLQFSISKAKKKSHIKTWNPVRLVALEIPLPPLLQNCKLAELAFGWFFVGPRIGWTVEIFTPTRNVQVLDEAANFDGLPQPQPPSPSIDRRLTLLRHHRLQNQIKIGCPAGWIWSDLR